MLVELTDLLSCPRCGPAHGLVLLVNEVEGRRVREGWLGCPSCRTDFPIVAGVADVRLEPEREVEAPAPYQTDELAIKIVALSGMAEAQGFLLLGERLAHAAPTVSELAPDLELIALAPSPGPAATGRVSWILGDADLPLLEYRLRCLAIAPGGDAAKVAVAARRVTSGGRLLLFDAAAEDLDTAKRDGLTILASERGIAVAERPAETLVQLRR